MVRRWGIATYGETVRIVADILDVAVVILVAANVTILVVLL